MAESRMKVRWQFASGNKFEQHLHRCSICDPALEMMNEVEQSNPLHPLQDCWDPEEMHSFHSAGGALEQFYKHT